MINPSWVEGKLLDASLFPNMIRDTSSMVIGLDELTCDNGAQSLAGCRHSQWGAHNCDHSKDVALACGRSSMYGNSTLHLYIIDKDAILLIFHPK